jgi:lysophospholipase L1-like esterase
VVPVAAMRSRFRLTLVLGAALALLLCMVGAGVARAQSGGIYVALGDSYTSAPLVPNQYGDPIDCGRSDHNYPSLTAQALGVATFVDVSCGAAETRHMTEPQTAQFGGINPPQFNALRPDATLVTVGIGGNDAGLVGVALECAQLGATQPTGHACRDHYAPGGHDTVAATIEATKPKIAAVLQGIRARSPAARVAIVGYPDPLPKSGGCYPMVPMSPDDIRYIDELIVRINAMIAGQAAANDAEFIDTYADSGGHDVCTLPPTRWFEGLVPTEPAYPLHPNAKGEASMARSALKVLGAPRPSRATIQAPVLSSLRVSPRNVRVGRAATVRFQLNRAAFVTLTLRRALSGRRVGRRCVAPSRTNRRRPRCTRYSHLVTSVMVFGRAGSNRFSLSPRRLGRRTGGYRLTASPTADGRRGTSRGYSFRLSRSR